MNIQTLTVFVTVAREGSLTRAAQKLHITQPAVGLHIKKLQEQTGLRLLMRTAQGMELTPDGSALLPLAEKVLQSQSSFKIAAHQLSKEIRGRLRIGTILDPEFIRLGVLLKGLLSRNQYLEIVLAHGMSGEVLQRVMDAELDAGFYLSIPDSVLALPDTILCKTLNQFAYKVLAPTGWESQVRGQIGSWPELGTRPYRPARSPGARARHCRHGEFKLLPELRMLARTHE